MISTAQMPGMRNTILENLMATSECPRGKDEQQKEKMARFSVKTRAKNRETRRHKNEAGRASRQKAPGRKKRGSPAPTKPGVRGARGRRRRPCRRRGTWGDVHKPHCVSAILGWSCPCIF